MASDLALTGTGIPHLVVNILEGRGTFGAEVALWSDEVSDWVRWRATITRSQADWIRARWAVGDKVTMSIGLASEPAALTRESELRVVAAEWRGGVPLPIDVHGAKPSAVRDE